MKTEIDFSRVTVRDFLTLMEPPKKDAADLRIFLFCNEVVVGGIMDVKLDALPVIVGQVAEEILQLPPETLLFFFTERDVGLIENCKAYVGDDPAGLPGHNLMMIISNFDDLVGRLMQGRTFKELVDIGREQG